MGSVLSQVWVCSFHLLLIITSLGNYFKQEGGACGHSDGELSHRNGTVFSRSSLCRNVFPIIKQFDLDSRGVGVSPYFQVCPQQPSKLSHCCWWTKSWATLLAFISSVFLGWELLILGLKWRPSICGKNTDCLIGGCSLNIRTESIKRKQMAETTLPLGHWPWLTHEDSWHLQLKGAVSGCYWIFHLMWGWSDLKKTNNLWWLN